MHELAPLFSHVLPIHWLTQTNLVEESGLFQLHFERGTRFPYPGRRSLGFTKSFAKVLSGWWRRGGIVHSL